MNIKHTIVIVAILLFTAGLTTFVTKSERIKPNKPFSEFPLSIKDWQGDTGKLDEQVSNILGVEDYILANFQNTKLQAGVNLYVGFYQSQKEGDIIHSPKNCMPGAGWNIISTSIEPVTIDSTNENIKVIKLLLQKGPERQIVLYWFQSRGRIIASEYMQKIWLVVDSITKHRTDGSFVRLVTPVVTDESAALHALKNFAGDIYPILKEYIPS